jgi:hypothetical protein
MSQRNRATYVREWRARNPGDHAAYEREWRTNNHERYLAYRRAWRAKNSERLKAVDKRYREANQDKRRARRALYYALESGRIKRQPCEVCANPKSQGHHDDYSKPFDVRWLCALHHYHVCHV